MSNCFFCLYLAHNDGCSYNLYYGTSYNLCASCKGGFKATIAFLKEADDGAAGPHDSKSTKMNAKDFWNGLERMKERDKILEEKVSFLNAVAVLSEGILTDILVKPGKGQPIPAHRALLAAKSEILRTMLLADDCKTAAEDTISLPELSYDELKCLLDFLYTGTLPAPPDNDSTMSLYYSLLIASDKYDIPFLRKQCCRQILVALHTSNALNALEATQMCSDATMKQKIINLIIDHAEEVVFSAGYEEFARKNAHLSVEIMRALLTRKGRNATSNTTSSATLSATSGAMSSAPSSATWSAPSSASSSATWSAPSSVPSSATWSAPSSASSSATWSAPSSTGFSYR